jgi:hypothetical protein
MMGVPPSDARTLTIWEFLAMRAKWNARHRRPDDDGERVEPPSAEQVRMSQADLYALGIAGSA